MRKNILILLSFISPFVIANEKPYFTSTPYEVIVEDIPYFYQITVADPDGDPLSLILNNKPDYLNYTDYGNDTALLSGVPTSNTENFVSISVTDGHDTVTQEFNIVVTCTNCCAIIYSTPITNAVVGDQYIYLINGTDVDRNVVFSVDSIPDWLTFTNDQPNSAILIGTPSSLDTGIYKISIKAERESALCPNEIYQIFFLTVENKISDTKDIILLQNELQIMPNPFDNELIILANQKSYFPIDIEIYNSIGQLLFSNRIPDPKNEIKLDLKNLRPDLYYLRMTYRNQIQIHKIIKK